MFKKSSPKRKSKKRSLSKSPPQMEDIKSDQSNLAKDKHQQEEDDNQRPIKIMKSRNRGSSPFRADYIKAVITLPNPYLSHLDEDHLYHLGIVRQDDNLEKRFGDVKFVCTGGSASRMEMIALMMKAAIKSEEPMIDISKDAHRYSMYKVGPVLFVNHGMGIPSLAILLHELFKLLAYAKCSGVAILRVGTCGGLGIAPGTLVCTEKAVDDRQRPVYEQIKLGVPVQLPATLDSHFVSDLKNFAVKEFPCVPIVMGTTMSTNEFYEGQGRVDGAFCDFTLEDRQAYLTKLKDFGIVNIEMEANAFAAFCHKAGIKCGVVNVVLVNRLDGDQVKVSREDYDDYQKRPANFAINYITKRFLPFVSS